MPIFAVSQRSPFPLPTRAALSPERPFVRPLRRRQKESPPATATDGSLAPDDRWLRRVVHQVRVEPARRVVPTGVVVSVQPMRFFQAGYLVPPIVAVYLGGLFFRRLNAAGAFWAIAGSLGVGVALFIAQQVTGLWSAAGLPAVHFTYMAIVMFGLASGILVMVSLLTAAPDAAQTAETTFRWSDLHRGVGAARARGCGADRGAAAARPLVMGAGSPAGWV